ncbi:50S ribosomal protein L9 [Deinococcus cellulosilyticus]|uniref:Large ribosomal subunit protein bL9 n=1 Tax=Deinococcus cellulosilyticus (strain DSM 18568 / NBRC 106333 / KACC 11606 / 5516J-15) TaxID=1223518 RepID=A0A511N4I9_DEIC1|nr:50S ribosomal protein L9 [Deinococcus cellulosilyticus]GEM47752.1 50S ribosomal protein L9 [Deinococcus cellulosilyticus NBRC 106333 = KACC 11606]
MSSVKVILLEPQAKLGKAGEVVNVKAGYARNFLVPQGLALPATASNMKTLEARIKSKEKQLAALKSEAEKLAEELKDLSVTLHVKAGEGKIYGAVTNSDVAEAVNAQTGKSLDRHKFVMPKAIKETGEYEVSYKAHHDVSIPVKLVITAH